MIEFEVYLTDRSITKTYKIKVDSEFAKYLRGDLLPIMDSNNSIDAKDLLRAFIKKSYESYKKEKESEEWLKEIKESI